MKNPIYSYATKTMKVSYKNTIINTLLYTLVGIFFFSEIFIVFSYVQSSNTAYDNAFGIQDGIIATKNQEDIAEIKKVADEIGTIESLGEFSVENSKMIFNINLGISDQKSVEINKLSVAQGRMPQNKNEIVIENNIFNLLKDEYALGDTITLKSENADSNYSFTLVGILNDYSSIQWSETSTSYQIPTAFTFEKSSESKTNTFFFSVILNDNVDVSFIENYTYNSLNARNSVYGEYSLDINMWFSYLVCIVIFMIVIFMLYAIYAITTYNSRKKISLLKIIGFTKKDIIKYFLFQYLIEIIIAIVISIITSLLILPKITTLIASFIEPHYNIVLIIVSIMLFLLVAISLIYIAVRKSANNSLLSNANNICGSKSSSSIKTNNVFALYAIKSYIINIKQSKGLSIPIISAILILSIGMITTDIISDSYKSYGPADITVKTYDPQISGDLAIPNNIYAGLSEQDIQKIIHLSEVKSLFAKKMLYSVYRFGDETEKESISMLSNQESFDKGKLLYGYEDKTLVSTRISSTDEDTILKLEKYIIDGQFNLDKLKTGEEIILCTNDSTSENYKLGDKIEFSQIIVQPDQSTKRLDFSSTIAAIIYVSETDISNDAFAHAFANNFLWHFHAFENLDIYLNYNELYIDVKDTQSITSINNSLVALENKYNSNQLFSVHQNLQMKELISDISKTFEIISILIFVIISACCLLFMFLSIIKELSNKKSLFGSLRSQGMGKKELIKMFVFKNIFICITSIIIGLSLAIFTYIVVNSVLLKGAILIHFPVIELIALSILYISFAIVACIIPVIRFMKIPIVECLRYD